MTVAQSPMLTVSDASAVYGGDVPLDDPAEVYHEASKLYRSSLARQVEGSLRLQACPELQESARRAGKRHPNWPSVVLPPPARLEASLAEVLGGRRTVRRFDGDSIPLQVLGTVLHAAYGVTLPGTAHDPQPLRTVPSGGALYPLELYAVAGRVDGLEEGLYHFDPPRSVLEVLSTGPSPAAALLEASIYPEIVEPAAATLLVTAMFWRSRFKYGLRGYRFALLEAGHVAQNALLAAVALGLGAAPLGGFYDRAVDEVLGVDGVNESVLYAICLGEPAADD
jgi:SagB-type dehydrogenase family enzyme